MAYVGASPNGPEAANGMVGASQRLAGPSYEFCGLVVETGAKAGTLRRGHKVVGSSGFETGQWSPAESGGKRHRTGNGVANDIDGDGPYAHRMVTSWEDVHRLPFDMPLNQAVLITSVAACVEGLNKLALVPGGHPCVIGAGPMGNLCVQVLSARGHRVTVVDPNHRWLSLLYKYDINTLSELGALDKYDYLIETTNDLENLSYLVANSNPSAKLLVIGPPSAGENDPASEMLAGDNRVVRSWGAAQRDSLDEAIRLVTTGKIDLDEHTAVVEPLERYPKEWPRYGTGDGFNVLLQAVNGLDGL